MSSMKRLIRILYRFAIAKNGWKLISVFDCSCYYKKISARVSSILISFLPLKWWFIASAIFLIGVFLPIIFSVFQHRLRMLLLQETFGFKWRNESMFSNGKRGKEWEINGKPSLGNHTQNFYVFMELKK